MPPLVPVVLAFMAGIWLAEALSPYAMALVWSVGLLSGLISLRWRHARAGFLALLLVWGCLGTLRMTIWHQRPDAHVSKLVTDEPQVIRLHGVVVEDPVELLSPNEPERQAVVVQSRHAQRQGRWHPITGLLRVRLNAHPVQLSYGDEVLLEGRWSSVQGPGNPGQFDWRAMLARQGIEALVAVEPFHGVIRLKSDHGLAVLRAVFQLRRQLEESISQAFNEQEAGLLRALLLGQRVKLDERLKQAFIETGTMHLVVVSGFNVGLIAAMLEIMLRLIGLSWRWRILMIGPLLAGYCVLTGMQAPVTRATIMTWVVLGALWMDRVINWPNALAAAALAILWINPAQLMDPGFQLSFGAVASLLVLTTRWRDIVAAWIPSKPAWLHHYVSLSVASTIAIWVGLWPLLAWYFSLMSPVSVLANLLLIPLVSVLVGVGTLSLMASALLPGLLHAMHDSLQWLLELTVHVVQWCAVIPWGSWPIGHPPWWIIAGYYALVVVSLARRFLRLAPGWVAAIWLCAINGWIWTTIATRVQAVRWLEMTVLDVGHGDSLVLRTPGGRTILIDTGTEEAGRYVVTPYLRHQGINIVDALVLTHPDADHAGGAEVVVESVRVRRLLTNGASPVTLAARRLMERAKTQHGLMPTGLQAGMRLAEIPGVRVQVLHPPAGFVPRTQPHSNDNSVVMKVTMGDVSLLLTGDLETQGLPKVMAWQTQLQSTVLKIPHHGSALGPLGREFFGQVQPRLALLSVGRLHGLPSAETLDALQSTGARIYSTRRDGALTIKTDGSRLLITTFRKNKFPSNS